MSCTINHPMHHIWPPGPLCVHCWVQPRDPLQCKGLCPRYIETTPLLEASVSANFMLERLFDSKNTSCSTGVKCSGGKQKLFIWLELSDKEWSLGNWIPYISITDAIWFPSSDKTLMVVDILPIFGISISWLLCRQRCVNLTHESKYVLLIWLILFQDKFNPSRLYLIHDREGAS